MLVDTDQVLIFDPKTSTLYSMNELPMFRNGLALQVNLPTMAELQAQRASGMELPNLPGLPAAVEPSSKKKRKKTARDRAMKVAIKEANTRYRKKNGEFRAGRTQADVMRLANKLADRMMK